MSKKNIFTIIIISLLLVIPTGCEVKKEAIDNAQFVSIVTDNEYTITDVTDQYAMYDFISSVSVAISKDKTYQIEFYTLDSEENAKKMYESNKNNFEENKNNKDVELDVNTTTYSSYSVTGDNYRYISRIANTLIYVDTTKEYKDEVKNIIKRLGY